MKSNNYENSIHNIGRIGIIIGLAFMLGIPAAVCSVYDIWPEGFGQLAAAGSGILAVMLPAALAEVISYAPILGSSSYITFLTGNVTNLKVPCVINAQTITESVPGSEEGDIVAAISVAVSSITTTLVIVAGVLLLAPLSPILSSPVMSTCTAYLLPALFGGMALGFFNDNCGEYIAKGKTKVMLIVMALVFVVNMIHPLAGLEGFVVIICMLASALLAYVFYKKGIIKMTLK